MRTKTSTSKDIRQTVILKENLFETCSLKASALGLSLPEYIRYLLIRDNQNQLETEYLTDAQEKSLGKSIKSYKEGNYRIISNIDEYVDELANS